MKQNTKKKGGKKRKEKKWERKKERTKWEKKKERKKKKNHFKLLILICLVSFITCLHVSSHLSLSLYKAAKLAEHLRWWHGSRAELWCCALDVYNFMWGAKQTLSHSCSLNFMLRVWVLGCMAQQGHREGRSSTMPFPEQHYCSDTKTIHGSFQPEALRGLDLGPFPQIRDLFLIFFFNAGCHISVEIALRDVIKETTDTKSWWAASGFHLVVSGGGFLQDHRDGGEIGQGREEKLYSELVIFCVKHCCFSHSCGTLAVSSMPSNLGCICSLVYRTK